LWNKICAKDLEDHLLQAAWLLTKKSSVYSFNALLRCEHFLPLLPQFPLPHYLNEIYKQKCSQTSCKKRYRKKNSAFPPEISLRIFQTSVWQLMDVRGTGQRRVTLTSCDDRERRRNIVKRNSALDN